jgi:hypothetical protein
MSNATPQPIKWSHSRLKAFETCPRKFYEELVLKKYPRTESEATIYGTRLHEACEMYTRDGTPLPDEFKFLQPTMDALHSKPGRRFAEYEMAVTVDLAPCGFKAPEVWCRGIADLLIVDDDNFTAWVWDYKSGSDKYPDVDQLVLMSLMVFAHFPHIRSVRSGLLFVLKETLVKHKMSVDAAASHWWKYRERVGVMEASFANDVWNPKSSGLCRKWCPCTGCEFNGKR